MHALACQCRMAAVDSDQPLSSSVCAGVRSVTTIYDLNMLDTSLINASGPSVRPPGVLALSSDRNVRFSVHMKTFVLTDTGTRLVLSPGLIFRRAED